MKLKVMFLSHSNKIPLAKRKLLEKKFHVGTHGADWEYGLLNSLWKLRGWDVIVCQTVYHGMLASLVVPDTPIVVENHGDLGNRRKWIARFVARRAWALRSVSRWTARQWDEFFLPDGGWKYHRIFPAWTDEDVFWEARGLYERSSLFHVLYAGGSETHKGVFTAAKLGFDIPCNHVYGLTQVELAREMAKAHVVVVPSKREGLGMVVLESFMVGRPVVASRVGGISEIVRHGKTGLLVDDPDDYERFVMYCKTLYEDRELAREIVMNATRFVEKFWTKEKWLGGYVRLVEEALDG